MKHGVKVNLQLLKLFVIAKRLGVTNETIKDVIKKRMDAVDQFYITRLLPLLTCNPKTGEYEDLYLTKESHGVFYIRVKDINEEGVCTFDMNPTFDVKEPPNIFEKQVKRLLLKIGCI